MKKYCEFQTFKGSETNLHTPLPLPTYFLILIYRFNSDSHNLSLITEILKYHERSFWIHVIWTNLVSRKM